jgi:flagellar biogenesis protein FliO
MEFIDSIQASLSGQFELSQLFLALLVILTLIIAERYYSRKR